MTRDEATRIGHRALHSRPRCASNGDGWLPTCPVGIRAYMSTDIEIDRALAVVTATLNDQRLERYDREHVQAIVTGAVGGERQLTVDDGGGLHVSPAPGSARSGAPRAVSGSPSARTTPPSGQTRRSRPPRRNQASYARPHPAPRLPDCRRCPARVLGLPAPPGRGACAPSHRGRRTSSANSELRCSMSSA